MFKFNSHITKFFIRTINIGPAIILFLYGCTYTPNDEYINPIEPPESEILVTMDVSDPKFSDPYFIINHITDFEFTFDKLPAPIVSYEVFFNGKSIQEARGGKSVNFRIFSSDVSSGTYKVKIVVKVGTGTNSLAERLEAEFYLVEKTFTVIIDKEPPPAIKPTASYENGFLTIRWEPTEKKNFEYVINRKYINPYQFLKDTIISDPSLGYFVDHDYVGGEIRFEIMVNGLWREFHSLGSVDFSIPPLEFNYSIDQDRIVHLTWDQVKIDTANTFIRFSSGLVNKTVPLSRKGKVPMDSLILGDKFNYFIDVLRDQNELRKYSEMIWDVQLKPNLKPFKYYLMAPVSNKLFLYDENTIYRYDLTDFMLEDSLKAVNLNMTSFTGLAIKKDESYGLVSGGADILLRFNVLDFLDTAAIDYSGSIPRVFGIYPTVTVLGIKLGNVSDNDLVSLVISLYGAKRTLVYDIPNDTVRWSSDRYIASVIATISNDGNQVFNRLNTEYSEVFERSNNVFVKKGNVKTGNLYHCQETNELISLPAREVARSWDNYNPDVQITIYDLNSAPINPDGYFNISKSRTIPKSDVVDSNLEKIYFDDVSKKLYTDYKKYYRRTIYLIQLEDLHDIGGPIISTSNTIYNYYSNNYHFISTGYIEKLP